MASGFGSDVVVFLGMEASLAELKLLLELSEREVFLFLGSSFKVLAGR